MWTKIFIWGWALVTILTSFVVSVVADWLVALLVSLPLLVALVPVGGIGEQIDRHIHRKRIDRKWRLKQEHVAWAMQKGLDLTD